MSSQWKETFVGEIADKVTKGTTPTSVGFPFLAEGVNYVKSESISFDGVIDQSKFAFIGLDAHEKLKRSQLEEGDILFSMAGVYIGKTAVVNKSILPANTNQAVGIIRLDKSKALPDFIDYCLRNPRMRVYANSLVAQSAQPNLNLAEISGLPISLPSLPEQKSIAHVLGTLDDKIELNRKINETLEDIAKSLFKSWFVDFDPVRAKVEGRPTGLPDEISELFPDSFEESELGEIPSGWSVAEIGNFLDLERDSVTPSDSGEEIFDHYSIPAYDEGLMPSIEAGQSIKSNKYLVTDGVFMVSKLNPRFPRIWVPSKHTTRRRICSTEFLVCRPKVKVETPFVLHVAKSRSVVQQMGDLASGTSNSHQRVRPADFVGLPFVKPSAALVKLFSEMVEPILEKHLLTRDENQALSKCRDALLPRLISGELRVPDAEKMLEEVGV